LKLNEGWLEAKSKLALALFFELIFCISDGNKKINGYKR
jgi:hypothetical protein